MLTLPVQLILLVACALLSSATTAGYDTDDDKRAFFRFHHISTSMTTIATSWTKVAFAVTLLRIVQNRAVTLSLWVIILMSNLVLITGMLSIWIPACGDPVAIYRPEHGLCWPLGVLQYLGGVTIGTISSNPPTSAIRMSSTDSVADSTCSVRGRCRYLARAVSLVCHTKSSPTDARKGWPRHRHEPRCLHRYRCDPSGLFPVR